MRPLSLFFYRLLFVFFAAIAFPYLFYNYLFKKKYRECLAKRTGFFQQIKKPFKEKTIWIHAVSVGETKAVSLLAKRLKEAFPEAPLIISSITETGHAEALRSIPFADLHIYLPFDFPGLMKRIVKRINPFLVLFSETDLWTNLLYEAKRQGAKTALVNGKISERSTKRMQLFSFYPSLVFSFVDLFCVQNAEYKERFLALGVDEKKIQTTGNLKFEGSFRSVDHATLKNLKEKLKLEEGDCIITIGSTHESEEAFFIKAFAPLLDAMKNLKILIVPRHPERFEKVRRLLNDSRFKSGSLNKGSDSSCRFILIDEMGKLCECYQLSELSIVGGSFFPGVGGHNLLEPLAYGVPVLFGPFVENQLELARLVLERKAGFQLTKEQVAQTSEALLKNHIEKQALGERGKALVRSIQGQSEKTLSAIKQIFSL